MGIFSRRVTTSPAFATAPIKAQAGASSAIRQVYTYNVGVQEIQALQLPTISRARDLMASMVGCLDLRAYNLVWDPVEQDYQKNYVEGETWFTRPDPNVTRNFFMSNLFSDLFFWGRAFAYVTSRYSTGFPASFRWLPAANISTLDQLGPQWFYPSNEIEFNGVEIDPENVVQFLSPIMGVVFAGAQAIDTAWKLDGAARRFAREEIPGGGYLQQRGGEPMTAEELSELAAAWASARRDGSTVGALNEFVEFRPFDSDPNKLQLVESRRHQMAELANIANVPGYLVGAPTSSGMTYQNAQQARQDLYLFGVKGYLDCIQETFSGDNVLPRGKHVEFDLDDYLGDNNLVETPLVDAPSDPEGDSGA